jgi:ATP-binding cassette subfamily B (MDR/TAP) protein 1
LVGNREINSNSGVLYSVGDVIVVFFTVYMSGLNLGQIPECIKNFVVGRKAAARIFSVIDREPLIRSGDVKITEPVNGMTFSNMQYYYENPLFENFELKIKRGKTAFVGESGCGKSTLVSLIMRYYDPVSGSINLHIGDRMVDLKTLNLNDYREKIGYVGQ